MASETPKLYIPPALRLINENIAKSGNPLGLTSKDCASWSKGLEIPTQGETILYTGCEYQMTSYVQSLVRILKRVKFEDVSFSTFKTFASIGRKVGVDLMKTYGRVASRERGTYDRLVRIAALTLRRLGMDFAYLDGELYSGALIYEYGFVEEFEKHAVRVTNQFREAGVRRIITLSPHSAEIFQQVYPQFIDHFDFEVAPFVVVIAEALKRTGMELSLPQPLTLTLHDPCHLARALKVTEEPREALKSIKNLDFVEVTSNREMTYCCGAPIEMVYPELAELIACKRVEQLSATGTEAAATLCPFCYSSLKKGVDLSGGKLKIVDFMEIVYKALGEANA